MSESITDISNLSTKEDDASPAKKRRCENGTATVKESSIGIENFCPNNMHLVSVLRSDLRVKSLVLHVRFQQSMDKDSIVILQKSPFPKDPEKLLTAGVVCHSETDKLSSPDVESHSINSAWKADHLMSNDVYHRLLVNSGLESVNQINMTIIHPAEEHHFKRFTSGGRCIVHESPTLYEKVILPYLNIKPRDLSWVENILSGKSEVERVLYSDPDPSSGFTLVQDYRWDGKMDVELHYLAIARDSSLTCLRDLRRTHVPMLQHIAIEGRKNITVKHPSVEENRILAYLHYPPTFYWLHVHFVHADTDDESLRAGRAHLLDEVIRNLQSDDEYYARRTMTICLPINSPMMDAIRKADCPSPSGDVESGDAIQSVV